MEKKAKKVIVGVAAAIFLLLFVLVVFRIIVGKGAFKHAGRIWANKYEHDAGQK